MTGQSNNSLLGAWKIEVIQYVQFKLTTQIIQNSDITQLKNYKTKTLKTHTKKLLSEHNKKSQQVNLAWICSVLAKIIDNFFLSLYN